MKAVAISLKTIMLESPNITIINWNIKCEGKQLKKSIRLENNVVEKLWLWLLVHTTWLEWNSSYSSYILEKMYSQNFHKLSLLKAFGIWSLKITLRLIIILEQEACGERCFPVHVFSENTADVTMENGIRSHREQWGKKEFLEKSRIWWGIFPNLGLIHDSYKIS